MMPQSQLSARPLSARLALVTLLQGLGWLSGLGVLSAGWALAEDQMPAVEVPSAPELFQAAPAPAPVVEAPAPVAPAPVAPDPVPVVEAPAPVQPAAAPVGVETVPAASSEPAAPAAIATPEVVLEPEGFANRNSIPVPHNDVFIDPTEYSVGATTRFDGPDAVVLSERSTGCQRILQSGQAVPGSICQAPSPAAATVAASRQYSPYRPQVVQSSAHQSSGHAEQNLVTSVVGQTTAAGRAFYNRGAQALNRLRRGEYQFVFPLTIPSPITSAFGWRVHPISGTQRFHAGTDIGAPLGTPVIAAQAGRVAISEFMSGYGLTVVMEHENDQKQVTEQSLYAHMSELLVEPGAWVEQGEVIGLVGSTGNSTGPHLHFELQQLTADGWVMVDPGQLLEYALAQLIETLRIAQANPQPQTPDPGAS